MHLISARQFNTADSLGVFFQGVDYLERHHDKSSALAGKIMAAIFYEPSTRTRFSFEAAMHKLGGTVISEGNPQMLSVAKGETLEDTIKTVSNYADVIVLRHPESGAAQRAAQVSEVPIINAGDGAGEHPTQALLDMYTIRQNFNFDGLSILVCGDLRNGRTVHSLLTLLSLYPIERIIMCCPASLSLPDNVMNLLNNTTIEYSCYGTLEEGLAEQPNVVYMTRLQKERLGAIPGWARSEVWNDFCLTPNLMKYLESDALVLHPLPRNEELAGAVDDDPRCVYFTKQVKNGLKVRMGLLYDLFNNKVCYTSSL